MRYLVRYVQAGQLRELFTDSYDAATSAQFALACHTNGPVELWLGATLVGVAQPGDSE